MKRVFISFEFERDLEIKNQIVERSRRPGAVFAFHDCSISHKTAQWKEHARRGIAVADIVAIVLGPDTHNAPGVAAEVEIARGLSKPFCCLRARKQHAAIPPELPADTPVFSVSDADLQRAFG